MGNCRGPARRFQRGRAVPPQPTTRHLAFARKCREIRLGRVKTLPLRQQVPGRIALPPRGTEVGSSPAAEITLSRSTVLTFSTFVCRIGFSDLRRGDFSLRVGGLKLDRRAAGATAPRLTRGKFSSEFAPGVTSCLVQAPADSSPQIRRGLVSLGSAFVLGATRSHCPAEFRPSG